jgi:hypothetical protein
MCRYVMVKQLLVAVATLAHAQIAQAVGQKVKMTSRIPQHGLWQLLDGRTGAGSHFRLPLVLFPILQHAHAMGLSDVIPENGALLQQFLPTDIAAEKGLKNKVPVRTR